MKNKARSTSREYLMNVVSPILLAILAASLANHAIIRWLKLDQKFISKDFLPGEKTTGAEILFMGSSLAFHAFSHTEINTSLNRSLYIRSCPAASPAELEQLASDVPASVVTVLPTSIFELNEAHISDYRTDLVPLQRTIQDLGNTGGGWAFKKNLISQYPLKWCKTVFPGAGASFVILVRLRDKLAELLHSRPPDASNDKALSLVPNGDGEKITLAEWPSGRTRRNLAALKDASGGLQIFKGSKWRALNRLIKKHKNEKFFLVILPVSKAYTDEFITDKVKANFEAALAELDTRYPNLEIIRFDQAIELTRLELYEDILHLNAAGRRILTPKLLKLLSVPAV